MKINKFVFSVDWEDFAQLSLKYFNGSITSPAQAIDRQTSLILDLLDKHNIKGTFFILGILAKYKQHLLKKIHKNGHEIALHGQYHEALPTISLAKIKADIEESYQIVTDIIGEPVYGYRAPFFSMNKERLVVLEILEDLGLIYDSSIFPSTLSHFGSATLPNQPTILQLKNGKSIIELPLQTQKLFGKQFCIIGGTYLRVAPSFFVNKSIRSYYKSNKSAMIYTHPYEFDNKPLLIQESFPAEANFSKIKMALNNIKWNFGRNSSLQKLDTIFSKYKFQTALASCKDVTNYSILQYE
jgi:polysaccharide deacetylase family protein (PEP-CTERM system associated)